MDIREMRFWRFRKENFIRQCLVAGWLMVFLSYGCTSQKIMITGDQTPGPQAIVYKTKANYSHLVPVDLSKDHSRIIGYPHPKDLQQDGTFLYPTRLIKGYLLDNRGISPNTAFLSLTYEEYAALSTAPKSEELYLKILDKNPFLELYDCGLKSDYPHVRDLNALIRKGFRGAKNQTPVVTKD